MDRNHDSRKKRGGNRPPERPSLNNATFAEKFPAVPRVEKKTYDPCPISGVTIENVFSAMTHRESGKPADFDAVLRFLRDSESIPEDQKIIYIGSGVFGIYQDVVENGRKHLQLLRKIVWEDSHHKPQWRKELAPGVSKDYIPHPLPLSQLYTPEEEREFPRLGAVNNTYLPRNS